MLFQRFFGEAREGGAGIVGVVVGVAVACCFGEGREASAIAVVVAAVVTAIVASVVGSNPRSILTVVVVVVVAASVLLILSAAAIAASSSFAATIIIGTANNDASRTNALAGLRPPLIGTVLPPPLLIAAATASPHGLPRLPMPAAAGSGDFFPVPAAVVALCPATRPDVSSPAPTKTPLLPLRRRHCCWHGRRDCPFHWTSAPSRCWTPSISALRRCIVGACRLTESYLSNWGNESREG